MAELPNLAISLDLREQLLPPEQLSILTFLQYPLPSIVHAADATNCGIESYFSPLLPMVVTAERICTIPIPPFTIVEQLGKHPELTSAKSVVCAHAPGSNNERIPTWCLKFWLKVLHIKPIKQEWLAAEESLQKMRQRRDRTDETLALISQIYNMLSCISWSEDLKGFSARISTRFLATYLTVDWLNDEHESQMLDLLRHEIHYRGNMKIDVGDIFFISRLKEVSKRPADYGSSSCYIWLQRKGEELNDGTFNKFVVISNIRQNHWVAIVVDFECFQIHYGDSLGMIIDKELEDALTWWIYYHTGQYFTVSDLPITRQHDAYSCGILAWNGIMVHLFPKEYQLLNPATLIYERLRIFLRIANRHNDKASLILLNCNNT